MSMTRPSAAQLETARALLALEHGDQDAVEAATSVYRKLFSRLSKVLGMVGVRAVFTRAAKLEGEEIPCLLELSRRQIGPDGVELVECLRAGSEVAIGESAAAFYARVLSLLGVFIGDHLTMNILRDIWPQWTAGGTTAEREKTK